MWWKILLFLGMSAVIVTGFITEAPQKQIGEASRIFYFHIPQAWLCVVAFAMSAFYSMRFLKNRKLIDDDYAVDTARLGFIFCFLATITGSIFAKVTWGSFWNWDPRETSIFILLLIYGAFFALRSAVEDEDRRATLSAVYSIFAFVTVPFLIFVVPRMVTSLHPTDAVIDENLKFTMGVQVRSIFFSSLAAFSVLYFWMLSLTKRLNRLKRKQMIGTD
ncbi:MAG: cytochrome c biogenesis protein CcsA [candidate division Zixibacteria bacterium]|nr:cytochrome c biogenesis protein CcsA [candidate division Zixibacteria bacterium]